MSESVETCKVCGWGSRLIFRYHGGVPVEHPICPSCGGELTWSYHFEPTEIQHPPEQMATFIQMDEIGFPEDRSPEVLQLQELINTCLVDMYGSPVAITNAEGVVDVEVRPYIAQSKSGSVKGMKLLANVGRSVYSMALLELLAQLGTKLSLGSVVPHPGPYGVPIGVTELFPFGTDVGLYFQHVISEEELSTDAWITPYKTFIALAVNVAKVLANAVQHGANTSSDILAETAAVIDLTPDDEFVAPNAEPIALESARQTILDPLLEHEHVAEELQERIKGFISDLGLKLIEDDHGYVFSLDSARVYVSVEQREERQLIRYYTVILSHLELSEESPHDAATVSRLLTTLNDQIVFGRCVFEPLTAEATAARVILEKTLLATDLDLSEFVITLVVMAEEADRIDNFLQDGLGGLRADQIEAAHNYDTPAAPLEPVVRQLAISGLPGVKRLGVEAGMLELRHLLEEVRLPIHEHESGDLAFTYGSSRIRGRVWEDERATYLTLRATVLRNIANTAGLAEALNTYNRSIHFGAFALRSDEQIVEMVETILIDDLSIEEFIYALVTLGELADTFDNILQEQFGGLLGDEEV